MIKKSNPTKFNDLLATFAKHHQAGFKKNKVVATRRKNSRSPTNFAHA
jgi:hypothetical protein